MRKLVLLTATAMALTCLGVPTLNAHAARQNCNVISLKGNRVIVAYGSGCNAQDILSNLQNCFPNITLPDCVFPENNIPETDTPDTNEPENELPEVEIPDTNLPEVELPDTDVPGTNAPDSNDTPTGDNNTEESTPEEESPENNTEHAFIKQVVDLVNAERAKEGLSPLTINSNVQAAAQVRAMECEQSFSHTRPNGSSFATALKEQGVSYRSAGENIAWGQRSPEEVMNAWMNSAGHRANIMNPNFTTIGVGYYQNARGVNYWCQLFTR
ncbi:MAG: CAP domain-containing protein [Lachnospiraceae bacterium]|nr:CAP domain-containing protein [Lachnospiraceae bacterium]